MNAPSSLVGAILRETLLLSERFQGQRAPAPQTQRALIWDHGSHLPLRPQGLDERAGGSAEVMETERCGDGMCQIDDR